MARKRSSGSFAGLEATKEMLAEADGMMLTAESVFSHSREIEIDLISPDFNQLRKVFEQEEIVSLAKTMAKQGQLQPILVRRDLDQRGRWIIVAGERRWRAAQVNGWRTILAIEHKGDHGVAS